MLKNLLGDFQLRGYGFEYMSKVMLRREKENNFIFQTCQFDSIDEILTKYRMRYNEKFQDIIEYLRLEWNRCDLIEFIFDKKEERNIEDLIFYDVKTKIHTAKRKYYEMCESNFKFFIKIKEKEFQSFIISIILFERWRFSFNLIPFNKASIKTYSNFKKS